MQFLLVLVAKYIVSYQGLHNEMMLFKYIYISFTETCTVFPQINAAASITVLWYVLNVYGIICT